MTAPALPALGPDATIGILGGGQLGRMLALAATKLGLKAHIYAHDPESPAFDVVRQMYSPRSAPLGRVSLFAIPLVVLFGYTLYVFRRGR